MYDEHLTVSSGIQETSDICVATKYLVATCFVSVYLYNLMFYASRGCLIRYYASYEFIKIQNYTAAVL